MDIAVSIFKVVIYKCFQIRQVTAFHLIILLCSTTPLYWGIAVRDNFKVKVFAISFLFG